METGFDSLRGNKYKEMSRTVRTCPRRHIEVPDGKLWHKCKCEWCTNQDRRKANEKFYDEQIKNRDNDFWYEGCPDDEILHEYWNKEWDLDFESKEILRDVA